MDFCWPLMAFSQNYLLTGGQDFAYWHRVMTPFPTVSSEILEWKMAAGPENRDREDAGSAPSSFPNQNPTQIETIAAQ